MWLPILRLEGLETEEQANGVTMGASAIEIGGGGGKLGRKLAGGGRKLAGHGGGGLGCELLR